MCEFHTDQIWRFPLGSMFLPKLTTLAYELSYSLAEAH